ncbi:LPS export ABC transporter permease LptF [Piscinibacter sp.]|uniref:LPS export ABC transporter permease LptF n=1 Tax=Piscinibacter sp. TaxID=1903157 RepID=UPI002C6B8EFB|nr:LPS export ABC transporter permease LptF [Albitalea sp.]HUG22865.1 LPS export ABC transporter permease LptF [Albitalea sp.]
MLFDSTLRRDLARNFGATLVVILTIVLTMMLIRTLGQAAGGRIAPQDVVLLLGYIALGQLPTMLALSMFIAVVATLGRMYRDSEMAIWFASGVGLTRFVRPVLRTSWPVLIVVFLLAIFVWPWVNRQGVELRDRFERRSDLSRVAPGQFQTSSDGRRVFFIERDSEDGRTGRNVFILSAKGDTESVTTAKTGHITLEGEDRFLVLDRGQRNELNLKTGEKTLSRFEGYKVLAGERVLSRAEDLPPKARPTIDLLRDPSPPFQGELAWRLGLVLGGTNLLLLGIGLAETNPRRASNWNLLFALLAFIVYYNLINLTKAWVAGERIGMGLALFAAHGGAFVFALALLWWRDNGKTRHPWRRAGTSPATAPAAA